MDNRYKDVNKLFSMALGLANEILNDSTIDLDSEDVFQLACEMAANEFVEYKEVHDIMTVGQVDNSRVAFSLGDDNTMMLITGDKGFADSLNSIVYSSEGSDDDDEN